LFTFEKYMKSHKIALKEIIPRYIVQELLSSRNIIWASFKLVYAKFWKSQSQLLNDTFSRFTVFVSNQRYRELFLIISSHWSVIIQRSRPTLVALKSGAKQRRSMVQWYFIPLVFSIPCLWVFLDGRRPRRVQIDAVALADLRRRRRRGVTPYRRRTIHVAPMTSSTTS